MAELITNAFIQMKIEEKNINTNNTRYYSLNNNL